MLLPPTMQVVSPETVSVASEELGLIVVGP
jgi:hypothetical protein